MADEGGEVILLLDQQCGPVEGVVRQEPGQLDVALRVLAPVQHATQGGNHRPACSL